MNLRNGWLSPGAWPRGSRPLGLWTLGLLTLASVGCDGLNPGRRTTSPSGPGVVREISDAELPQAVAALPVLVVDCHATWCGPCRQFAPEVEATARALQGRATVVKMNVDDCPETSAKYKVRGVPTVLIFKNGELVYNRAGAMSSAELRRVVESHLPPTS